MHTAIITTLPIALLFSNAEVECNCIRMQLNYELALLSHTAWVPHLSKYFVAYQQARRRVFMALFVFLQDSGGSLDYKFTFYYIPWRCRHLPSLSGMAVTSRGLQVGSFCSTLTALHNTGRTDVAQIGKCNCQTDGRTDRHQGAVAAEGAISQSAVMQM